jgi:hypothetical protein
MFSGDVPEAISERSGSKKVPEIDEKRPGSGPGSEKADFREIVVLLKEKHDFRGSGPPKIDDNRPQIGGKTTTGKIRRKLRLFFEFGPILVPFWVPEIDRKPEKNGAKKRPEKRPEISAQNLK